MISPEADFRPTVLVTDDSRLERKLLEHLLAQGGFPVVMACDGHEAMKVLEKPDAPRLVILDWEMPGPSGPELARWLRDRPGGHAAYVLLLTGRDATEDIVLGLESGADDFMTKPFRAGELLARVGAGVRVLWLQKQLEEQVAHLESALAEVRTLRGFIPICMHCRRIRTDSKEWQGLETYIEAHSDASFSHALCDECLVNHYPEEPASADSASPASTPERKRAA